MAGNYKVTFFYEGLQQASIGAGASVGWSESYYTPDSTLTLENVITHPDLDTYITKRKGWLPNRFRFSFVRVTQVDSGQRRRSKLRTIYAGQGGANVKDVADASSQVQCALLVDMMRLPAPNAIEPSHHRRGLFRGLPAAMIDGDVIALTNPFQVQVSDFFGWLCGHEAGQVVDANNPPPQTTLLGLRWLSPDTTNFSLDYVGPDAASNQINVAPNQGTLVIVPGKFPTMRVSGTGNPYYDRQWHVVGRKTINIGGTPITVMVLGKTKRDTSGQPVYNGPGGAVGRLAAYSYGLFSQYTIIGLRSKRTGGIFRRLRGKR